MSATRDFSCVLDASALLTLLQREAGAEEMEPLLEQAALSSVNWSEVVQKSLERGVGLAGLRGDLEALALTIAPFTVEDAEFSASMRERTAELGHSLADRACLTLSIRLAVPALTTNRAWAGVEVDAVSVRLIR